MKTGDFIRMSFTLTVDGNVIDTTREDVARAKGIFRDGVAYSPMPIILGERQIIEGLEEELLSLGAGESKTITLPPEKAFGQRNPQLVRIVPLQVFKASGLDPRPGQLVTLEDVPARIQSVSGGRVRVDMNHDLAGKTVVYDVKVEEILKDDAAKAKMLGELAFGKKSPAIELGEKEIRIKLGKDALALKDLPQRKLALVTLLKKHLGKERVEVSEEY